MKEYTLSQHKEYLKKNIEKAIATGLRLNVTIIANGCCKECDKIHGVEMPLEEFLQSQLLPYNKCIRKPFCICDIGFEGRRDVNGRLLKK